MGAGDLEKEKTGKGELENKTRACHSALRHSPGLPDSPLSGERPDSQGESPSGYLCKDKVPLLTILVSACPGWSLGTNSCPRP